jgi:hypothetical protein
MLWACYHYTIGLPHASSAYWLPLLHTVATNWFPAIDAVISHFYFRNNVLRTTKPTVLSPSLTVACFPCFTLWERLPPISPYIAPPKDISILLPPFRIRERPRACRYRLKRGTYPSEDEPIPHLNFPLVHILAFDIPEDQPSA